MDKLVKKGASAMHAEILARKHKSILDILASNTMLAKALLYTESSLMCGKTTPERVMEIGVKTSVPAYVELALQFGVDSNKLLWSMFYDAELYDTVFQLDFIIMAIKHGADVSVFKDVLDECSDDIKASSAQGVMYMACKIGNIEIAKIAQSFGACVDSHVKEILHDTLLMEYLDIKK